MDFTSAEALLWTQRLIAAAVVLQTLELLMLRSSWIETGVWRWSQIRDEFTVFPGPIRNLLDHCLDDRGFHVVLWLRLLAALAVPFVPDVAVFSILLASTTLICLRWRGTFNGGSDFMTLIVLMSVFAASLTPENEKVRIAVLWYIALQCCASYFISGCIKLKRRGWRTGRALSDFIKSTIYSPAPSIQNLSEQSGLMLKLSWAAMIFECSFPLALLSPQLCLMWIGMGIVFHCVNFYVFGLNRFLFAWAATYPALYFCSQRGI